MGDRITIAEARHRRTDPVWRRRHKLADLTGVALVAALFVLPPIGGLLWRPLGVALSATLLLGAPLALWVNGPRVGLDRRTALLVAVPIVNLFVLVPAIWRGAHLHLQRWKGPLQPPWEDGVWAAMGALGVVLWLVAAGGLVLSLV